MGVFYDEKDHDNEQGKALVRQNIFDALRRWMPTSWLLRLVSRPRCLVRRLFVSLTIEVQLFYQFQLLRYSTRIIRLHYRNHSSWLVKDHRVLGIVDTDKSKIAVFINC